MKTALEQFYEIVQTYKLEEMIQRLTMIDFRAGTEPMDLMLNEEDLPYEEEFLEVEPTFRVTGAVSYTDVLLLKYVCCLLQVEEG